MELVLVGWATSRPITNLPLMVLDHDYSAASRNMIIALENTGTFQLEAQVDNLEIIEIAIERGQITAGVIIPPDYSKQLASYNGHPTLAVILNGAESVPATAALQAIEGVTRNIGEGVAIKRLGMATDEIAGFVPSLRVWFNEALSEALYTTPAELGLMLEFTILLFAALSFSRERELGTLEQLLVMPFSSMEIIVGKAIPVILVGFIDFIILLGLTHFAFDVPIRGSLSLLILLALVYTLVMLCVGMVISVISRSQHQAFLFVMIIGMVDFMFTGYAAPVESMPRIMQYIANIVPSYHWLTILRGIALKGIGMEILWLNALALAILGLAIGIFSLRFIRRVLD